MLYNSYMKHNKQRSTFFTIMLVISVIGAISYMVLLDPEFVREAYGNKPYTYEFTALSAAIYIPSLIALFRWKRWGAYGTIGVIIFDALVFGLYLNSAIDSAANAAHAALLYAAVKPQLKSFK